MKIHEIVTKSICELELAKQNIFGSFEITL